MEDNEKSKLRMFFEGVGLVVGAVVVLSVIAGLAINWTVGAWAFPVLTVLVTFLVYPYEVAEAAVNLREAKKQAKVDREAMFKAKDELAQATKFIKEFTSYAGVLDRLTVLQHDYRESLQEAETYLRVAGQQGVGTTDRLAQFARAINARVQVASGAERHLRELHGLAAARGHEIPPIEQFLAAEK